MSQAEPAPRLAMDAILTLNAGSSSIKFALFRIVDADIAVAVRGQISGIGSAPKFRAADPNGKALGEHAWTGGDQTQEDLLQFLLDWIVKHLGSDRLVAVGHRVVHGGRDHDRPALVTADLMASLEALVPLAPLHQPHNLAPIRAVEAIRPGLSQVACFDTAFHHAMPMVAARIALPREFEEQGVRRYGFHGLSYEYIVRRLRVLSPDLAAGRVIVAHLGNGASLCAMKNGQSQDTTMSFTPLDGLVMGTRCGSIDPGAILYLLREHGMNADQVEDLLDRRSGLLGVSGVSSDMRVLLDSDDPKAAEAVELFVFHIAREAGAMASTLGGVDGIVFTGGIGEHAAQVRALVCKRLAWLGVEMDDKANDADADIISTAASRVEVRMIPTDEEAMIARHTLDLYAGT
ncbi:MAG: acetate/propionate family kinase [Janthinobacterium lividum]